MSASQTHVQQPGWYDDPAGQARFRYWDGRHWTHQTTNARNPQTGAPALGAGFARLADWLARGMALVAAAAVAVVAVIAWATTELGDLGTAALAPHYPGMAATAPSSGDDVVVAILLAFGAYVLFSMLSGLAWVVWEYQLAESAPAALRRGPAMHVLSWFVPVLNWWWPYQNMVDLWNAYGTGRERRDPDVPSGIGLWWGAYLGLPVVVAVAGFGLIVSAGPDDILSRIAIFYGAGFASQAVSALLARGVVNRLSWRALEYCASAA